MLEEECTAMKSTLKQLQQDSAETISSLETRNKQIESELSSKISELKSKEAEMEEFGESAN